MARREQQARIIARFDDATQRQHLAALMATQGLSLLSDDGIARLARSIATAHRFQQKLNRENRARRA
jgi:hypothetical protein